MDSLVFNGLGALQFSLAPPFPNPKAPKYSLLYLEWNVVDNLVHQWWYLSLQLTIDLFHFQKQMSVLQNLKKFTFCAKLCGSEVINKCNPEVRRKTEALNNMKTAQYRPILRNGKDDFFVLF